MRRIKEERRAEESRQRLVAIITTTVVSLAGVAAIIFFIGGVLWHSFVSVCNHPDVFVFVLPTLFCLLFFVVVNHWLHHRYKNAQSLRT